MPVIKAQRVPQKEIKSEDVLGRFCYHYPQYKYSEARRMPYVRVLRLLNIAAKEEARKMHELTRIVAGPHTKKGQGTQKMLKYYQSIINK